MILLDNCKEIAWKPWHRYCLETLTQILPGKVKSWGQYRNHSTYNEVTSELGGKLERKCLENSNQKLPENRETDIAWKNAEWETKRKHFQLQTSAWWILWDIGMKVPRSLEAETWKSWNRNCLEILKQKLPGNMWSGEQYRNILNCKKAHVELGEKLERVPGNLESEIVWKSWNRETASIKSAIAVLVRMRTKLRKWSAFRAHFTQKVSFSQSWKNSGSEVVKKGKSVNQIENKGEGPLGKWYYITFLPW